jgi:hypothetical protein
MVVIIPEEVTVMTTSRVDDKICVIHDSKRAEAMATDATAFCGQCGALAHDPKSVCHPIPFEKPVEKKE